MEEAKDSKLVSKLFTQGRHRNVSVILILQNAFPKGKYNAEISRNAMYMVLFRSPADREQMKRVGQRMFPCQNDLFMEIYRAETEKPYGNILIDNKPETLAGHQVLSNIFGKTLRYNIGDALKTSCIKDPEPMVEENGPELVVGDSMFSEENESVPSMTPPPLLTPVSPLPHYPIWTPTPNAKRRKKKYKQATQKSKKCDMNEVNYTRQSIPNLRGDGFGGLGRCQSRIIMM